MRSILFGFSTRPFRLGCEDVEVTFVTCAAFINDEIDGNVCCIQVGTMSGVCSADCAQLLARCTCGITSTNFVKWSIITRRPVGITDIYAL